MNALLLILGYQVSLGLTEILIFQLGAILLGFSIHFVLTSKKAMRLPDRQEFFRDASITEADEWRLKYYQDTDIYKETVQDLKTELEEAKLNEQLRNDELEELRGEIEDLQNHPRIEVTDASPENYLLQLKDAQENLSQHNQHIGQLLQQIDVLKESERKYRHTLDANEALSGQIRDLRQTITGQEATIRQFNQQQLLFTEMRERMEKTRQEFEGLREKLQKIETGLADPRNRGFEYDELQQSYFRIVREFDEFKGKYHLLIKENQRLIRVLADTEDKLRESSFQRRHLTKRVGLLEELNQDLRQIAEQSSSLRGELRRLEEIEQLIARISEEKDEEDK